MRALLLGLGSLTACHAPLSFDLALEEVLAPDSRTVVLALEAPGNEPLLVAFEAGGAPPAAFLAAPDARLGVAAFHQTMTTLGLPPGQPLVASGGAQRLPLDGRFFSSPLSGVRASWEPLASAPALIADLTLPPLDLVRCAEAGGCLRGACAMPCLPPPPAPAPPAAPRAPMAPELGTGESCPPGWAPTVVEGLPLCRLADRTGEDPPCPEGQWRPPPALPRAACQELTGPCEEWPLTPDEAQTAFVRPGGAGDGSRGAPFGTISAALASGRPHVALARGVYPFDGVLARAVRLRGSCPAETTVQSSAITRVASGGVQLEALRWASPGIQVELPLPADGLALRRVALETDPAGVGLELTRGSLSAVGLELGGSAVGLRMHRGTRATLAAVELRGLGVGLELSRAELKLAGARIQDVAGAGLVASGSTLTISALEITRTGSGAVELHACPTVSVEGAVLAGSRGDGLRLVNGRAVLRQLAILDSAGVGLRTFGGDVQLTQGDVRGSRAGGVVVAGGRCTARELLVEDSRHLGLDLSTGASVDLQHAAILEERPLDFPALRVAMASLRGEDVVIAPRMSTALFVHGGQVELTDLVVAGPRQASPVGPVGGIIVLPASTATLSRVRADSAALTLATAGARLRLVDARLSGSSTLATAFLFQSRVSLERAQLLGSGLALEVAGERSAPSEGELLDVELTATGGNRIEPLLRVGDTRQLDVRRLRIGAGGRSGVQLFGGTTCDVQDLAVQGAGDPAVLVGSAQSVALLRVALEESGGDALRVEEFLGRLTLGDLLIQGAGSDGLDIARGRTVIDRFLIRGVASCGARYVSVGGHALSHGRVEADGQARALCVLSSEQLDELTTDVALVGPIEAPPR